MNKLEDLKRRRGSIPAKTTYDEKKETNWGELKEKINTTQENRKSNSTIAGKEKKDIKRLNVKVPEDIKFKMEAQKKMLGLKFDYQLIDLLLEKNFESFTDEKKSMYTMLVSLLEQEKK